MKSEFIPAETSPPPPEFPCYKKHKDYDIIVLFIDRKTGVVVYSSVDIPVDWTKLNYIGRNWATNDYLWKPVEGEIRITLP